MSTTDSAAALRTVFMGTPELAVPSLQMLARRTALQQVITQPDRPAGRGRRLQAPPVKVAAESLGLPVWQPPSLRHENAAFLQDIDLVVVLAYGELLRQPLLDAPRLGCVNLHASLLPRWRGASPLQAAIRAGDAETGVTVMRMVRALDAGPIYLKRPIPLSASATLPWLHDRMAEEAALALADFLDHHLHSQPQEQDPLLVTVCGKLGSADGRLDWRQRMQDIDAQVRAYEPSPGCWAPLPDGHRLRVRRLRPDPQQSLPAGHTLAEGGRLWVGCGDGAVELLMVQAAGKRAMDAAAFLNGHALPNCLDRD